MSEDRLKRVNFMCKRNDDNDTKMGRKRFVDR